MQVALETMTRDEKDDSFWFSDKLEDWYGLKPKITVKVVNHCLYDYNTRNPEINGNRIKRSAYSSMDAGAYLGIDASTFIKYMKKINLEAAFTGNKKYSHEQVLKIEEYIKSNPIRSIARTMKWEAKDISERWNIPIKQVKKVMTKKSVTYNAARLIANKLKQK